MRSKEFNEWKKALDFLDSKQSVVVIKELLGKVSFGDRLKLEKYIVDEIHASNEDAEDENLYNGIICKGSIALGSACMKCEKCKMELEHLDS